MNKIDKIKSICLTHSKVCLSINEWVDIMKNPKMWELIDVITTKDILMTGHYGTIFNCKIFVSKIVAPNHILISKKDTINHNNKEDWSPAIDLKNSLSKIEKYLSLCAFW